MRRPARQSCRHLPARTLDFPLRCDAPLPGEDLSYVLYGSGGCSLFDTEKLLALGGMDEIYDPVYAEDLDLGFRAWQQGWPSVFVAGAQTMPCTGDDFQILSAGIFRRTLELHYLRFLTRTITSPRVFSVCGGMRSVGSASSAQPT